MKWNLWKRSQGKSKEEECKEEECEEKVDCYLVISDNKYVAGIRFRIPETDLYFGIRVNPYHFVSLRSLKKEERNVKQG